MSNYKEGLRLLEEKFGNGKDNVISLSTIAREPGTDGKTRPVVKDRNEKWSNFLAVRAFSIIQGELKRFILARRIIIYGRIK